MKRLCPKSICGCKGGFQTQQDWPVLNLSSEAADALIFTGVGYVPFDPYRPPPLGDGAYFAKDCTGTQFSVESQEIANLIARLNAFICQGDGQQFSNDPQTAFLVCHGTGLDFSIFWYTVPAGTFVSPIMNPEDGAAWVEASNAQALAFAQQQVSRLYCCLSSPQMRGQNGWECLDHQVGPGEYVYSLSGPNSDADYNFQVTTGGLPSGLTLGKVNHNTAELTGAATPAGKYSFTIRATRADSPNVYAEVADTLEIFGINNAGTLPDCKVDNAYSFQLNAVGDSSPYTFNFSPADPPPSWMTITSSGLLGGTPTSVAAKKTFTVTVTDANGRVCGHNCSIKVTGPKFINSPDNGTQCSVYHSPSGLQLITDPSGCTFTGSCPAGLSISPSGLITGAPNSPGPASFVITATDPQGNVNTKTWSVTITPAGLTYATAIKDMVWANQWTLFGGASYTQYSASGGDLIVGVDMPSVGSGLSAVILVPTSNLGECGGNPSTYSITVDAVWTITGASTAILNQFDLHISSGAPCISLGALNPWTSGSAHVIIPAGSWSAIDGVGSPTKWFLDFNHGAAAGDVSVVVQLTIRPLTPP